MSGDQYVIGLDIGTSSIKGILRKVDEESILFGAKEPFYYDTDCNGMVQIDAVRYLDTCLTLLKRLLEKLPKDCGIKAISCASASGNVLLLDENHTPITPIFNWQDKQTKEEVITVLGNDFDYDAYYRSTGWAFDQHTFPLATLCRLKVHQPNLLKKAKYVCMSTEYLYYVLTGRWGISTSAGTPFYVIDQQTGKYRQDIIEKLGLHHCQLPPVLPVGTVVGTIKNETAEKWHLIADIPILCGTFDHPSAARGVDVTKPGQLLLSCGTSWVGFFPVSTRELAVKNHMLIDPFLSETGGSWAGMVSLASVASQIENYIRKYITNEGNVYTTFESYAKQSQKGANGLAITFSDKDSEKTIRSFEKYHIARAIMEGVVTMLKKDLDRMAKGGIDAKSAVMVGGPTECPFWSVVIHELTGLTVTISRGAYAGAMGASLVAENKTH